MKQLEKVLTQTTWADASNAINTNNDALYVAVTTVENAAFRHKGYYKSAAFLRNAYPTAEEGSQAFVYNASNSPSSPYDIYSYFNGAWIDTGLDGGSTTVDLSEKQDTLTKYKESASDARLFFNTIQNNAKTNDSVVYVASDKAEIKYTQYSSGVAETFATAIVNKDGFTANTSKGNYITASPSGQVQFSSNRATTTDPSKTHNPLYSAMWVTSSQAWMMHYQQGTVDWNGKQRQKGIGIVIGDNAISFYSELGNYDAPMEIRKGKSDGEKGTVWVKGVGDLKTFMLDLKARVAALEKALNITNEVQE